MRSYSSSLLRRSLSVVLLTAGVVAAQPALNLPSGPVFPTVAFRSVTALPTSYLQATFTGLPSGLSISNSTTYLVWCADQYAQVTTGSAQAYQLYDTYGILPSDSTSVYWSNVNWVLNNKPTSYTGPSFTPHSNMSEVEDIISEVIWRLLNGEYYRKDPSANELAAWNSFYNMAIASGSGFIPGPGQTVGVLMHVDGIRKNDPNNKVQDLVMEVKIPSPSTCSGQMGDFVWNDENGNGLQDVGEPGINGVTVSLYKNSISASNLRATTVTGPAPSGYSSLPAGSNGYYQFTGLCSGTYYVVVSSTSTPLVGLVPTTSTVGTNTAIDSNGSPATVTMPTNHTVNETIDFGYVAPLSPPTSDCAVINATFGVPITPVTLNGTGGAGGPYTFTATGLPPGLKISSSGTISGTPTASGPFTYTVTVTDGKGNTGTHNCSVTVPAPACVIPPSGTAIGGSAVSWNKFNPQGADVVWIHAHIGTPSGVSTSSVTTISFTGVTFVLNGQTYPLPDGLMILDPAASATPSTMFDPTAGPNGQWTTTFNPSNLSDEMFFDGNGLPVDSNISGGGQATFNYTTSSSDPNLSFSWQWSAAVFTYWPGNNQAEILPYHQSDHAGTPENTAVQQSLIQGPRGGGGSNFTGSWSGTGQGSCPGN